MRLLGLALLVGALAHATTPGKAMRPLAESDEELEFFVGGFYATQPIRGVELLWIPAKLQKACMGHEPKFCTDLSHCLSYPTQDPCRAFDQKLLEETKPRDARERFLARVNDQTLYLNPGSEEQIIEKLLKAVGQPSLDAWAMSLGLSHPTKDSQLHTYKLNPRNRLRAKIHWIQWPNGLNVQFLEFSR